MTECVTVGCEYLLRGCNREKENEIIQYPPFPNQIAVNVSYFPFFFYFLYLLTTFSNPPSWIRLPSHIPLNNNVSHTPLVLSAKQLSLSPFNSPSSAVRGGLTMREGLAVCEAVRATGHLGALDLVEVNPTLGTGRDAARTAHAARLLLLSALTGYRRA